MARLQSLTIQLVSQRRSTVQGPTHRHHCFALFSDAAAGVTRTALFPEVRYPPGGARSMPQGLPLRACAAADGDSLALLSRGDYCTLGCSSSARQKRLFDCKVGRRDPREPRSTPTSAPVPLLPFCAGWARVRSDKTSDNRSSEEIIAQGVRDKPGKEENTVVVLGYIFSASEKLCPRTLRVAVLFCLRARLHPAARGQARSEHCFP